MLLVANIGSTSFKFRLFEMPAERVLARGGAERLRSASSPWSFTTAGGAREEGTAPLPDYDAAIRLFEGRLASAGVLRGFGELRAIVFKPVLARGFSGTRHLNEEVLAAMEAMNPLFPAHNPPYIAAVRSFRRLHPGVPCVGTFETAFYDHLDAAVTRYAIPLAWEREHGVRRYGFHGASHRYANVRVAELRGGNAGRVISVHLGGSSSLCAARSGRAVDSSWGMTAQSGLPQNNRVGDFDAFATLYLARIHGIDTVEQVLSTASGLQGMAGTTSGDIRDVKAAADAGSEDARTALAAFVHQIRRHLGALLAVLGGCDDLVFTGGIGENNPWLREAVCRDLGFAGIRIDPSANAACRGAEGLLSPPDAPVAVRVIPANEELVLARDAWSLLHAS